MGRASNIIAELLAPEVEEGLVWVGGGGWSLEGAVCLARPYLSSRNVTFCVFSVFGCQGTVLPINNNS